jgi:uncharacterized protein
MVLPHLIEDLKQPAAYPWRPPSVELIETHISWVFLAGDRVVKVKRPVDLGFVDFTSGEQRREASRQEVELNRRLSTGVYRGVVPIARVDGHYQVAADDGQAVEWATLMRRLPADRMLDALIAADAVPKNAVDELAGRLIPFHLEATPSCADFGARALAVVTENLDQLRDVAGDNISRDQLGIVDQAMRRFSGDQRDLLAQRALSWIREGHGDLRAEHICFETDGSVQVFDCVEFSREIRCADVASDLAFLLMDLRRLGAGWIGDGLLERYREAGADLPDPIIRFYATHRALVRAKVACLAIRALPSEHRQALIEEAVDYLHLATAFAMPVRPALIVVSGLSGTGKSTVATAIARALDLPVHASDAVRKELAQLEPDTRAVSAWQTGLYAAEWTRRTYDRLRALAADDLSRGQATLLDATFLDVGDRQELAVLAAQLGVPFVLIETDCDEVTALQRIRERAKRANTVSDATEEVYLRQREAIAAQPPPIPEGTIGLTIDTTRDGPVEIAPVLTQLVKNGVLAPTPAA